MATLLLAVGVPAPTAAASEPVTYLPVGADTALTVAQGNGEPDFRSRDERFAFDFTATDGQPGRFEVAAARGGTIMSTRDEVPGGRCQEPGDEARPACWHEVDYVLIDHGDGTSGLYLHLRPGSVLVRSGDVVTVGQPLAQAGASGWTDRSGLQFQVQSTPVWDTRGEPGWFMTESQPVAFADADVLDQRPDGVPQTGDTVVSSNPGPTRDPFRLRRRPTGLRATVPFEIDQPREDQRRLRSGLAGRLRAALRSRRGRTSPRSRSAGACRVTARLGQPTGLAGEQHRSIREPRAAPHRCWHRRASALRWRARLRRLRQRRLRFAGTDGGHRARGGGRDVLSRARPPLRHRAVPARPRPVGRAAHHRSQRAARPLRRHPAARRVARAGVPDCGPCRPRCPC